MNDDEWTCALCFEPKEDRGAALACCSDKLEDRR